MYVYAMLDYEGDVKIGWSAVPYERSKTISWETGRKIAVVIAIDCDDVDYQQVEKTCHRLHRAHHITGEWFNITIRQAVETIRMVADAFRSYPTYSSFMMLEWLFYERSMVQGKFAIVTHFDKKQYMMERK